MNKWNVTISDAAQRKIKKYKSSQVLKRYLAFVAELKIAEDPALMGRPKTGKYKNCFGCHLTKSVSMIYKLSRDNRTVYVLDVGDHKELYMRDNRS